MVLIYIMSDNLYDITDEEKVNETKRNNELAKVLFKTDAPPILIGGPGKILPCLDLCNYGFNFRTQSSLEVMNLGGKLFINTDVQNKEKSSMYQCNNIAENCSENLVAKNKLFHLSDIIITSPGLHKIYINEKETIMDGEIFIVFYNKDLDNYNVLCVLLEANDDINVVREGNSLKLFQFFKALGNDLPNSESEKKIKTIADWEIDDLLPRNRTFYNYFHPNNLKVNWFVYRSFMYVPSSFKINFINKVSSITKQNKKYTGNKAYNILFGAIGKLQNPVNPNFQIFENRDLDNYSRLNVNKNENIYKKRKNERDEIERKKIDNQKRHDKYHKNKKYRNCVQCCNANIENLKNNDGENNYFEEEEDLFDEEDINSEVDLDSETDNYLSEEEDTKKKENFKSKKKNKKKNNGFNIVMVILWSIYIILAILFILTVKNIIFPFNQNANKIFTIIFIIIVAILFILYIVYFKVNKNKINCLYPINIIFYIVYLALSVIGLYLKFTDNFKSAFGSIKGIFTDK